MEEQQFRKILAANAAGDFLGRSRELELIVGLADGDHSAVVSGAPGSGISELLKQAYDRLFREQSEVIPFYFALSASGETVESAARRFLHQFLLQTVAFRRRDNAILNWFPDLWELAELAPPADGHWVDRLVSKFGPAQPPTDEGTILKTCLGAPARAGASGARVLVMIDNAHAAARSCSAAKVLSEIESTFAAGSVPYVIAGHRRYELNLTDATRVALGPLGFGDLVQIIESHSRRYGVAINDETRDLIANQFGGNLDFVRFMFQSAAEKNEHLDRFLSVQRVYAQEIFGGRIRRYYDSVIDAVTPDEELQKSIISLLDVAATLGPKLLSAESWLKRLAVGETAFTKILALLDIHEVVRLTSGRVEAMTENQVLTDYVASRFRLEIAGESRAALFGESVATYLKRAPRLMAEYYRRLADVGLRDLLGNFSLQRVPSALLDYGIFVDSYKGLPEEEVAAGLEKSDDPIQLPQIVYTANASDLYKPIGELTEKERSAVAMGFEKGLYNSDDEIVWVAAEIDSKMEAPLDLAEFWCDRLEMAALMCGFQNYKIWLVAPEGFSPNAVEMLRERGAYGSSRRQAGYLKKLLAANIEAAPAPNEYEIVVPMDDESELVAAHTLEEIARRHNVAPKAINQIKTALLEASINASEHSLSPDRRIRQKFRVEDDRITITISNRGIRLADRKQPADGPQSETASRRGWGLKLIEKLMDEVKIEQTDDGTSISMIKYLREEVLA